MSFDNTLTIGSNTFLRQTANQFIEDSSDVNTPDLLIIQNRNLLIPNGSSPAQITVKRDKRKDSLSIGLPDSRAQAWFTFSFEPNAWVSTELLALEADLHTLITTPGHMAKLMRSET